MEKLSQLITVLQLIAVKNDDDFTYRIDIDPTPRGLEYRFVVTEKADGHEFLSGQGGTIEWAVTRAENGLQGACDTWGYDSRV